MFIPRGLRFAARPALAALLAAFAAGFVAGCASDGSPTAPLATAPAFARTPVVVPPATISAANIGGVWSGTLGVIQPGVPIQLQLSQSGKAVTGSFVQFAGNRDFRTKMSGSYDGVSSFVGIVFNGHASEAITMTVGAGGHSATGLLNGHYLSRLRASTPLGPASCAGPLVTVDSAA